MMKTRIILSLFVSVVMLTSFGMTKEKGLTLTDLVLQMKMELDLTDEQVKAIHPIILKYAKKRQAYLESLQGEAILNKTKAKAALKQIKKEENQALSSILTDEQMQKRITKQNLKDSLNRGDVFDFENQNEDVTMTPQGGSMQF